MGDFSTAEKWFNHYAEVDETMLRCRDIVIANKLPRRLELQPNLVMEENKPVYRGYSENIQGVVESFLDRFGGSVLSDVYNEWIKDAERIRAPQK